MNKRKTRVIELLIAGMLALLTVAPTYAGEPHFYAATHGLSASFYLIGGQYDIYIYVYTKRPIAGSYAPESHSCIFGGNFQRIWPTHDATSLGSGIGPPQPPGSRRVCVSERGSSLLGTVPDRP